MVTSARLHQEQGPGPVFSHHWIRHTGQSVFHAYMSVRPGEVSICGNGKSFDSVHDMDVPGPRSKCCAHCCEALFGRFGYRDPAEPMPSSEQEFE